MPEYKRTRKQLLSDLLSGAEIDPLMKLHCEALMASANPLLLTAAIGFLLDGACIRGSAKQRSGVEYRAGLWVEAMPEVMIAEIEQRALVELERQIRQLRGVDLSTLDSIESDVLRNQRKIIEAVNTVLMRAKRMHLNQELADLDDLLPPGF